jgi:hypothetical protein
MFKDTFSNISCFPNSADYTGLPRTTLIESSLFSQKQNMGQKPRYGKAVISCPGRNRGRQLGKFYWIADQRFVLEQLPKLWIVDD